MERVEGGDLDAGAEGLTPLDEPGPVGLSGAAGHQVQQAGVDLSVLVTSEVDHAGELLGAPPAVLDGSVRISSHGVNSRHVAQPCGDFPDTVPAPHATDHQSYRPHPGLSFACVLRPSVRSSAVRRLSAGGREGRRSRRMCPHAHQEPRGDCRATRGGHVATETGQAEDRRPVEPSGIGSITAPLNIEREGTHVFHRTRRGKDRPPALALALIAAAQFVVIMDTSIIGVAFAV